LETTRITVLLVDSHLDSLIFIRDLLEAHRHLQFQVEWEKDYKAALLLAQQNRHDVALVNAKLGEQNGLEFLEEARRGGVKMPLILLTGQDDYSVDMAAMRAGAADYLLKGQLDADRLARSIRYAVQNARHVEALRETEVKFRSVVESADSAILSADSDGNIIYANQRTLQMFGYSQGELLGRPLALLLPERHRADHQKRLERLRARPVPTSAGTPLQIPGLKKGGAEFPTELSLATWETQEGRFFSEIIQDITARKAAQQQIGFQADILAQVNDAVVAVDISDNIIYWNQAAQRLFQISSAQALGKKTDDLFKIRWIRPEDQQAQWESLAKTASWQGEHVIRVGSREIHSDSSMSLLKKENGVVIGTLYVIRDITVRKKLEAVAIQAEKLAALGQLAAGVVHEVKTPLGVILGYADVLLDGLKKGETPDGQLGNFLEIIRRQTLRCNNIVNNLLDFSRKGGAEHKEYELNEAVTAALSLVAVYAMEKTVRLQRELCSEPLKLRGHKDQIEQVIINLCNNAIDAMPGSGTLTVRTAPAQRDEKPWAEIQVIDTGTGIPPEVQKVMFEPFFTTKEAGKGTGLGLWLVQQIISSQSGKIECASQEGKGTTFTVSLPMT
jgi:two-component system, cell cycle sensor histidine kinase and response regulator CckA